MTLYLRPLLDEGAISSWSPSFRVLWNHPIWVFKFVSDFDSRGRAPLNFYCPTCAALHDAHSIITSAIHTFEWMGPIAYSRQSISVGACTRCNTVVWSPSTSILTPYEDWQFEKIAEQQANTTRLHTGQDSEPG